MKFRKKPVVVEAFQNAPNALAPVWFSNAYTQWRRASPGSDVILIKTLEGEMRAERGDWIIRGVAGELYPCKPDIFAATYEPAE